MLEPRELEGGNQQHRYRRLMVMRMFSAALIALALLLAGGCGDDPEEAQPAGGAAEGSEDGRVQVFTHCGWYEIEFDGRMWSPTSIRRGSMPEGTDGMSTPGVATVDGDVLTFTADSGLVVEFGPAPADLEPVPGCD